MKQSEDVINENERGERSFYQGFFYYTQQSYSVYEYKRWYFSYTNNELTLWKSAGIDNLSRKTDLDPISDSKSNLLDLKTDGRMYVYLSGNYFQQNGVVIPNNNNVINIYCVYKLQSIAFSR